MSAQNDFSFKPVPLTIALQSIKCLEETNEVGADEPYVLVTSIDLKKVIPQVEVTRYGPWADVDKGETKHTSPIPDNLSSEMIEVLKKVVVMRIPFWGLDNETASVIAHSDDVIFIVSVMEHDDGNPEAARGLVKGAVIAAIGSSMGMKRDERVKKLIADIKSALAIPTGILNFDDHIGTKELRLTGKDLLRAALAPHHRTLFFVGDGGHYKTSFVFTRG